MVGYYHKNNENVRKRNQSAGDGCQSRGRAEVIETTVCYFT